MHGLQRVTLELAEITAPGNIKFDPDIWQDVLAEIDDQIAVLEPRLRALKAARDAVEWPLRNGPIDDQEPADGLSA